MLMLGKCVLLTCEERGWVDGWMDLVGRHATYIIHCVLVVCIVFCFHREEIKYHFSN